MTEINLYLIGDDPVLQIGLEAIFAEIENINVVLRTKPSDAVERIRRQAESEFVEIALLEWSLQANPSPILRLCDRLRQNRDCLKIVLLCDPIDPQYLTAARNAQIQGYCPKGSTIETIRSTLEQVAEERFRWPNLRDRPTTVKVSITARWLHQNARAGLSQIDRQLLPIEQHLENEDLSMLDWLFWTGRRRELRVTRWLVNQLLPPYVVAESNGETNPASSPTSLEESQSNAIAPQTTAETTSSLTIPQSLFEKTRSQLQLYPINRTQTILSFDILKPEKQRELLYIVLRELQDVLEELRFLTLPPDELAERRSAILREIWQNATLDFYSRYYTLAREDDLIVDVVMQDAAAIQGNFLDKIPFVGELLAYLLFDTPLTIDRVAYRSESPEAQDRAQLLLNNLILQIANAVLQLLLNHFAELEIVKQRLYEPRYQSSRQIARIRNELSWQYRQNVYLEEPLAIFESRYNLLTLKNNAIVPATIRASRLGELAQLQGIPWFVTIVLETRDAIAPRVRAVVSFVGRGVIYLLVQVIGRGIGLIGRGILQGFGNALQETRYGRRR